MTMTRNFALLALILSLPILARAAEPAKTGFVPLFNGKDLTGWVNVNCNPRTFFVKDGEIITTGRPTGFLRTARQYENFILDFDWMHVNKDKVGNSGLFVWGDPLPAVGSGYTRGIEVQVLVNLEYKDKKTGKVTATSHGDLFSIWGATCKPDRPHPLGWLRCLPNEYRAKGGGEWNHYKVTARDGTIKLEVNGKEVSGVSECKPRKGYLALESEGAECHFKNLMIKELPSSNPKPEEIAKVDQGFRNLYLGDLSGWKVNDDVKAHWKPSDWRLVYDGKGTGVLRSAKEYGDVELIADFRLPGAKAGSPARTCSVVLHESKPSAAFVAVPSTGLTEISTLGTRSKETKPSEALRPLGQWNRLRITMKAGVLSARINDKELGKIDNRGPAPEKGPIALKGEGGPVDFANIFIRELK